MFVGFAEVALAASRQWHPSPRHLAFGDWWFGLLVVAMRGHGNGTRARGFAAVVAAPVVLAFVIVLVL